MVKALVEYKESNISYEYCSFIIEWIVSTECIWDIPMFMILLLFRIFCGILETNANNLSAVAI